MKDKIEDGGPAFPARPHEQLGGGIITATNDGMTLRDWFAGQVLSGNLGNPFASPADTISKRAYEIADAMIEARKSK
jgi:hypothetical protein